MEFDPRDPNLDGDFKALVEARLHRKRVEDIPIKSNEESKEKIIAIVEEQVSSKKEDSVVDSNIETYLDKLISAVNLDDVEQLKTCISALDEVNILLQDPRLRTPESQGTILHTALENGSMKIAKHLIENGNEDFLVEEYNIQVRGTPSTKTVLHLLCERADLELCQILLSRLQDGPAKEAYIRKTVLTEIQGQRPRHLSCIHIAALKGCTGLVEYLVKRLGVDVNLANNKEDTPILWAARWNHLETAKLLIHFGADLQHQNDKGSSPLYWAVRYGFKDMVELLINEGRADVHQQRKLGLVSPIVLSSALGYTEITEVLLNNGADVNVKINSGNTPLHYAAMENNITTAMALIMHGADLKCVNDAGDSPFLVAVKAKGIAMVNLLAERGSDIDIRNKEGNTMWDYALDGVLTEFLSQLITMYKNIKGIGNTELMSQRGKTPLHKAAMKDDPETLACLLGHGVSPGVVDEGGNTFYHLAARENSMKVLKQFDEIANVNAQNDEGETALHLATRLGHTAAVKVLLKRSKIDLKNEDGEIALHTASKSQLASNETVNAIMDTIAKAHSWSLVSAVDKHGNTALHNAARFLRKEIFSELKQVNPRITNNQGECAQHVVVKMGQQDVAQEFFKSFKQEITIDEPNKDGDTVVHVAAQLRSTAMLDLVIAYGADLTARNNKGNTPMHELVLWASLDKENMQDHVAMLDAFLDNSIDWWCMRNDQYAPDEDSDYFLSLKRQSYLLLTSEIYNNDGYSVLNLAAKLGVKGIFERIVQTPEVYMFQDEKDAIIFDVTMLTRDTVDTSSRKLQISRTQVMPQVSEVDPNLNDISKLPQGIAPVTDANDRRNSDENYKASRESCLGLIVRSSNIRAANDMLDVMPLQVMVSDYWVAYKWMYGILMIIHVIYMSFLSSYGLGFVRSAITDPNYNVKGFPEGLLLSWPIILVAHFLFIILSGIQRRVSGVQKSEPAFDSIREKFTGISFVFRACLSFLSYYLSYLTQIAFATLVIIWFVLYLNQKHEMAHVLAAALIFGWLFTIVFTPGFENVHSYSIMIKGIFVKDISRFIILYAFVLMAFTFALQSLMYLAPEEVQGEFPTQMDIMFAVFNMMIGMYDPFSESITSGKDKFGEVAFWIKFTYVFYIVFTTIILLNLLIAMMTDSYADVKANEGSTWRVTSVAMALSIDTSLPVLPRLLRRLGARKYIPRFDVQWKRWLMTIPTSAVHMSEGLSRVTDPTSKALYQAQRDVNRLQLTATSIEEKIDALISTVRKIQSGQEKQDDTSGNNPPVRKTSRVRMPGDRQLRLKSAVLKLRSQLK